MLARLINILNQLLSRREDKVSLLEKRNFVDATMSKVIFSRRETSSSRHVKSFLFNNREDIVSLLEKRNFVLPATTTFFSVRFIDSVLCPA